MRVSAIFAVIASSCVEIQCTRWGPLNSYSVILGINPQFVPYRMIARLTQHIHKFTQGFTFQLEGSVFYLTYGRRGHGQIMEAKSRKHHNFQGTARYFLGTSSGIKSLNSLIHQLLNDLRG
jgi:hypothetical protein